MLDMEFDIESIIMVWRILGNAI